MKEDNAPRESSRILVAVIGAGPAGLFAAETLLARGFSVSLLDAMPEPGRKFLLAGNSGGLNITNALPPIEFAERYGINNRIFSDLLDEFSPAHLIAWLSGLGFSVTRGSGGKIFPAAPVETILEAWIRRLSSFASFSFHPEWRFIGFGSVPEKCDTVPPDNIPGGHLHLGSLPRVTLRFETSAGPREIAPAASVFALGGASWPSTGSTGAWSAAFAARGIPTDPFLPANCGFEAEWPPALAERFSNIPLKNIVLSACGKSVRGELMLTPYGLEGGVVYTLGARIRDSIENAGSCAVSIDLLPDWTTEKIEARLASGAGKDSLSNYFRKRLGLDRSALTLLRAAVRAASVETPPDGDEMSALRDPARAAFLVKAVPVTLYRPRPIAEAISSAGGIRLDECDGRLMLKKMPGIFCAGEMLSWEAPTGGFLLQGCFSTAYRAAAGAAAWLTGEPLER